MDFSGCEQCCQMPLLQSSTLMTETKLKSAHVHHWDDQWRYSNSKRINHMLGDLLISTQLLVTHLVTTFLSTIITIFLEYTWSVGSNNKMSMLSPSICFDYLSGQTEREKMIILGTSRTHRISPMTIATITDWKCRDQVTDQELVAHNVTKHVIVASVRWMS